MKQRLTKDAEEHLSNILDNHKTIAGLTDFTQCKPCTKIIGHYGRFYLKRDLDEFLYKYKWKFVRSK